MKLYKDGIAWGGQDDDYYHFFWWNWLPKRLRYIGYSQDWYDGPMSSFGFWFFNWTWALPFTSHNGKKDFSYRTKKNIDTNKN